MSNNPHSYTEQDGPADQPNPVVRSSAGGGESFIEFLSIQLRRFLRALLTIIVGVLCGAALGFVVFLLLQSGWERLSDGQPAPSSRPRGGDPINAWARGYVMMFYCGLVMTPFVATGLWLGVRVAFLGPVSFRQQSREIVTLLRRCAAGLFSTSQLWGRCSLLLAVAFWPVGFLGLSSLGTRDSPAGLCLLLSAIIAASTACGAKGLTSHPRRMAIIGLVVTVMNAAVLSRFLYQIGPERLL